MKRIVIGNWKMNLTLAEAVALAQQSGRIAEKHPALTVVIAPSLPWLTPIAEALPWRPSNFYLSSQVVSPYAEGAYTGDVAAKQLKGVVSYCLVGHSERRKYHHETGGVIADQIKELVAVGITPVVCFGELSQSSQGTFSSQVTLDLSRDLSGVETESVEKCLFAYEPIWAIGTGTPATPAYIEKAAGHIREWMKEKHALDMTLLYGGSVTDENAADIGKIKSIDGLLVGGASLQSKRFGAICAGFLGHV